MYYSTVSFTYWLQFLCSIQFNIKYFCEIMGKYRAKMDMMMNKSNGGNTTVIHYMKYCRVPALTHYFLFT